MEFLNIYDVKIQPDIDVYEICQGQHVLWRKRQVEDLLSGKFSISDLQYAKFTRGNLFYNSANSIWGLETAQDKFATSYDIDHTSHFFHTVSGNYGADLTWNTDWKQDVSIDWGVPYNEQHGTNYHTLSKDEWNYLLNTRIVNGSTGMSYAWQYVNYNSTNGTLIYHDDYTGTRYGNHETITEIPEGCPFLPFAGKRAASLGTISNVESQGDYWVLNSSSETSSYYLRCLNTSVNPNVTNVKSGGMCVRLAQKFENIFNKCIDVENIVSAGRNFTITIKSNDSMELTMTPASGTYERVNIPLKNLEPNSWYEIDFSEELLSPISFGSKGVYGCCVLGSVTTSSGSTYITTNLVTKNANDINTYCWCLPGGTISSQYTQSNHIKLKFLATAETMYWLWDYSLMNGNASTGVVTVHSITKVEFPETAYVGLRDTSIVGAQYDSEETAKGTYKMFFDETSMTNVIRGKSGTYEKINIPIYNLTIGKTYSLSFTHERDKSLMSTVYDYCYNVIGSPLTKTDSTPYRNTEGYITNYDNVFQGEVIFTATAETM